VIEYRRDDTIVTDEIRTPFRAIVPGSVGDLLRRNVCPIDGTGQDPR
jgi:hypothetical protein